MVISESFSEVWGPDSTEDSRWKHRAKSARHAWKREAEEARGRWRGSDSVALATVEGAETHLAFTVVNVRGDFAQVTADLHMTSPWMRECALVLARGDIAKFLSVALAVRAREASWTKKKRTQGSSAEKTSSARNAALLEKGNFLRTFFCLRSLSHFRIINREEKAPRISPRTLTFQLRSSHTSLMIHIEISVSAKLQGNTRE